MSDTIFGSADFSDLYTPRGGHIDPSWWIYRSITVSIYTYHDKYIALLSSLKKLNALKALDDLRRWKKCHYALKKKLGQFVRSSDFPGVNVTIDGGGSEGYLEFHPQQTHLWPDYYYLNPIPRNERVLNPQLEQNPGWESEN